MSDLVEKAKAFAYKYHEGQIRKSKDTPFTEHLEAAVAIVKTLTKQEEIIAATWLHDVVEDTDATLDAVISQFGAVVSRYVALESEDKREGQSEADTWKARKQEQLERLRNLKAADRDVYLITLSDKLANLEEIHEDLKHVEDPQLLWNRFNNKNSDDHGWYYKEMAKIIKQHPGLGSSKAFKRMEDLINSIWDKTE